MSSTAASIETHAGFSFSSVSSLRTRSDNILTANNDHTQYASQDSRKKGGQNAAIRTSKAAKFHNGSTFPLPQPAKTPEPYVALPSLELPNCSQSHFVSKQREFFVRDFHPASLTRLSKFFLQLPQIFQIGESKI